MKVKNISNKVIVIGEEVFLPNDEKEIPASYEDNPVVREYLDQKFLADAGHLPAEEMQDALQKAQAEIERYRAEAKTARAEAARETRGRAKKENTAAADSLPSPCADDTSAGEPQTVPAAGETQAEPKV